MPDQWRSTDIYIYLTRPSFSLRNFNKILDRKFSKGILVIDDWGISCEIALIWMSLDFTDNQSTLVQVMAWCHQATSHYLSQCWPRSLWPYGVTRPKYSLFPFKNLCVQISLFFKKTWFISSSVMSFVQRSRLRQWAETDLLSREAQWGRGVHGRPPCRLGCNLYCHICWCKRQHATAPENKNIQFRWNLFLMVWLTSYHQFQ